MEFILTWQVLADRNAAKTRCKFSGSSLFLCTLHSVYSIWHDSAVLNIRFELLRPQGGLRDWPSASRALLLFPSLQCPQVAVCCSRDKDAVPTLFPHSSLWRHTGEAPWFVAQTTCYELSVQYTAFLIVVWKWKFIFSLMALWRAISRLLSAPEWLCC